MNFKKCFQKMKADYRLYQNAVWNFLVAPKRLASVVGVLLLCGALPSAAGSMIGLDALGKEDLGGATAATAGRGYAGGAKTGDGLSLMNPSALAFEEKVSFAATVDYEWTAAESDGSTYASGTLNIPSLYLSFPMKSFGTFALGISQHYASHLKMESEDSVRTQNVELEYSGSVFEIVPVYSLRLPFFRKISLGAAMHIVAGSVERSVKLGPDNSDIPKNDAWATNNSKVTEIVEGDWETESIAYYTLSAMYRGIRSGFYFSVTTPYTLVNNLSYDFRFSQVDTLQAYEKERKIKIPLTLAAGVDYRVYDKHHVLLDVSARAFDEDIPNMAGSWDLSEKTETQSELMMAIGYQKDGSKLFYDSYLARMQFRLGAWYRDWYIKDVSEFGGAIGAGFPLGSRGTMLDVAFQGGKRNGNNQNFDETFIGARVTLMGVGSWGNTRPNR